MAHVQLIRAITTVPSTAAALPMCFIFAEHYIAGQKYFQNKRLNVRSQAVSEERCVYEQVYEYVGS